MAELFVDELDLGIVELGLGELVLEVVHEAREARGAAAFLGL